MDPYIGKMLDDRYEILERIGTGGMAVVYKAKCHRLNRLVAVKILKSDLAQDADFRRRFHAESKAVAMLSHTNIVSVYDVSQSGETEYIVMELIDGITLKQYMERRGKLNWRESLHFMTQIMKGISHAHSRGIVHRDIKPQNIMVLRDGSVKVADFGIACLENSAQTLTQEALGSVHYISPEQARGDRTDARSDIYSAGVMFYEMLTGRLPFEGDSAVSVAIQHLSSIPLPPREIDPDLPKPLELICMRAMAPDIEKRYQSADAMIADLEAFRRDPEVDLDYSISDLQDLEPDEPTRYLPTAPAGHHGQTPVRDRERDARRRQEPERGRPRDYDRYEREPAGGKKRLGIIIGGTVAAALLIFLLFNFVFNTLQPPAEKEYTVPNVVGRTLEEAQSLPEIADGTFKLVNAGSEYNSDYPQDQILRQDPTGDRKTKTALEIRVWVSLGEKSNEMPNLVNQSRQRANILLKELDLDLEIDDTQEEFSDEFSQGWVIRTEPVAEAELKAGDKVTLYISKGPEHVKVPVILFVGSQIDLVEQQVTGLKLVVGKVNDRPSDRPAGEVLEQSIPAYTEVEEGTTIDFVVSKGPEPGSGGAVSGQGSTLESIALPSDRTTVHLEVYQDGVRVINDANVDCSLGNYPHTFYGTGSATLEVFWDGVSHGTYSITFDNE